MHFGYTEINQNINSFIIDIIYYTSSYSEWDLGHNDQIWWRNPVSESLMIIFARVMLVLMCINMKKNKDPPNLFYRMCLENINKGFENIHRYSHLYTLLCNRFNFK